MACTCGPEPRCFLCDPQVMGADDPLQVTRQVGTLYLECYGLVVRIGRQDVPLAHPLQGLKEKIHYMRVHRD